jgi:hypothetical protein
MITPQTFRRFRLWILGLYVFAQFAGIVPLLASHFQHEFASPQLIAVDLGTIGTASYAERRNEHHHGTNEANDQCCTLHHHLAGTLTWSDAGALHCRLVTSVRLPVLRSLAGTDPGLPERPPKLRLYV